MDVEESLSPSLVDVLKPKLSGYSTGMPNKLLAVKQGISNSLLPASTSQDFTVRTNQDTSKPSRKLVVFKQNRQTSIPSPVKIVNADKTYFGASRAYVYQTGFKLNELGGPLLNVSPLKSLSGSVEVQTDVNRSP